MKRTARKQKTLCRLGVYDICEPRSKPELVGEVFDSSKSRDRAVMRLTIVEFNKRATRLCMAAFPVKGESAKVPKVTHCRLALYDPTVENDEPEFLGPVYHLARPDDVWVMRLAIRRFNRIAARRSLTFVMAPFPWK